MNDLFLNRNFRIVLISGIITFFSPSIVDAYPPRFPALQKVQEEITLLNLLRGLYLSKDQVTKIRDLAQKANSHEKDLEGQINSDLDGILAVFSGLNEALYESPGGEKPLQRKALHMEDRIRERVMKLDEKICGIEADVKRILSSAQLSIIEDFEPCLVPPEDFNNPVRVGQAAGGGGIFNHLADLIRATPEDVWKKRKATLLAKTVGFIEGQAGAMKDSLKNDFVSRLQKNIEAIRTCPDIDFEVQKSKLASELLLIDPRKKSRHAGPGTGKISLFFLSEIALKVYPKWLKNMENNPHPKEKGNSMDGNFQPPGSESASELGARIITVLRPLYFARQNLESWEVFISPVLKSVEGNQKEEVAQAMLSCVDKLIVSNPDFDLKEFLMNTIRIWVEKLGLPVAHPEKEIDFYGYGEEIRQAMESSDAAFSCGKLRDVLSEISRFRKPFSASRD